MEGGFSANDFFIVVDLDIELGNNFLQIEGQVYKAQVSNVDNITPLSRVDNVIVPGGCTVALGAGFGMNTKRFILRNSLCAKSR